MASEKPVTPGRHEPKLHPNAGKNSMKMVIIRHINIVHICLDSVENN